MVAASDSTTIPIPQHTAAIRHKPSCVYLPHMHARNASFSGSGPSSLRRATRGTTLALLSRLHQGPRERRLAPVKTVTIVKAVKTVKIDRGAMRSTLGSSSNAVAGSASPSTPSDGATASTGVAHSVVHDGTESYIVASRKLLHGEIVFDRVGGSLSTVSTRHSVQVGENQHLSLNNDMALTNHSCAPNCQIKIFNGGGSPGQEPHVSLVVRASEISEGEMITLDYNAMEVDMADPFDCRCGAANCRGRIAGFSKLAPDVQAEYIADCRAGGVGGRSAGTASDAADPPFLPPLTAVVKAWLESTANKKL